MSRLPRPDLSRLSEYRKAWLAHFRSREFTLVIAAATFGSAYLCDWVKVPEGKRHYIVMAFTVSVGIAYILNPKSVGWMTDAPALLETLRSFSELANQPTKEHYDALTDPLDNATQPAAAPTVAPAPPAAVAVAVVTAPAPADADAYAADAPASAGN